MKTETVKLLKGFFLTEKGEECLDAYNTWKTANGGDNDAIKARREKLKASGLVRNGPTPIKGGLVPRIVNALDGEDMNLAELVESINSTLSEEGNGESVNLAQVRACVNFQLKSKGKVTDHKGVLAKKRFTRL